MEAEEVITTPMHSARGSVDGDTIRTMVVSPISPKEMTGLGGTMRKSVNNARDDEGDDRSRVNWTKMAVPRFRGNKTNPTELFVQGWWTELEIQLKSVTGQKLTPMLQTAAIMQLTEGEAREWVVSFQYPTGDTRAFVAAFNDHFAPNRRVLMEYVLEERWTKGRLSTFLRTKQTAAEAAGYEDFETAMATVIRKLPGQFSALAESYGWFRQTSWLDWITLVRDEEERNVLPMQPPRHQVTAVQHQQGGHGGKRQMGKCAICQHAGHWANECPEKDSPNGRKVLKEMAERRAARNKEPQGRASLQGSTQPTSVRTVVMASETPTREEASDYERLEDDTTIPGLLFGKAKLHPRVRVMTLADQTSPALVEVEISDARVTALVDTGASVSLVSKKVAEQVGMVLNPYTGPTVFHAGNDQMHIEGQAAVLVGLGTKKQYRHRVLVYGQLAGTQMILGLDFLRTHRWILDIDPEGKWVLTQKDSGEQVRTVGDQTRRSRVSSRAVRVGAGWLRYSRKGKFRLQERLSSTRSKGRIWCCTRVLALWLCWSKTARKRTLS
jgi:predicted aspartyl protease